MAITVGLDFGTHQTKICYERSEAGTLFYDVFKFKDPSGEEKLTLPSFIRRCADGTLRYGHEAAQKETGSPAVTYFKQIVFSWTATQSERNEAELWAVLYLAYVVFHLDVGLHDGYSVHMGMPTDADPEHYGFCKWQAVKVLAAAMLMVRQAFKRNLSKFLATQEHELKKLASECLGVIPSDINAVRRRFPILVFPEAYVALIPLINDRKLPSVGPNLFVDIGGGTVDISFFTNQMDESVGVNRPCLYQYHSVPYGLNMITGQNLKTSHNVEIGQGQITRQCVERFRRELVKAVTSMMHILKEEYVRQGRTHVMPFTNLCGQILDRRPICYSGGGSMFSSLKLAISDSNGGVHYNFAHVTTVSELIDHSKLYVSDKIFHVLATAFALSHQSLISGMRGMQDPDSIKLVSVSRLFSGIVAPRAYVQPVSFRGERPKRWTW